jgi:hypothetical protein
LKSSTRFFYKKTQVSFGTEADHVPLSRDQPALGQVPLGFRQRLLIRDPRPIAQLPHGLLSTAVAAPGQHLGPGRQWPDGQPLPEPVGEFSDGGLPVDDVVRLPDGPRGVHRQGDRLGEVVYVDIRPGTRAVRYPPARGMLGGTPAGRRQKTV